MGNVEYYYSFDDAEIVVRGRPTALVSEALTQSAMQYYPDELARVERRATKEDDTVVEYVMDADRERKMVLNGLSQMAGLARSENSLGSWMKRRRITRLAQRISAAEYLEI